MKKTMLILYDDEPGDEIIKSYFTAEYEVLSASSLEIATNLIKENADSLKVIILNVTEKVASSFLENHKISIYKKIPVITVTGNTECAAQAIKNGASDVILKPVIKEIICARVSNVAARYELINECITNRKLFNDEKAIEDLKRQADDSLENYRSLINAVPGGIVQYEIKGGKIFTRYFSEGICELTGWTREEREKMNYNDVMSITYPEDLPMLNETLNSALVKHKNISLNYRMLTKSGEPKWVHLSAAYSRGSKGEDLYHAVFTDIDKAKKTEAQLKENQLRYEVAIKSSGINIWEYDICKDCLYVISNSARVKQNCFYIENYVESTLKANYVREDSIPKFLSIFSRLKKGVKEITEDIWYKSTNHDGWWCERVTYTTIFSTSGVPVKAFGAGRDVTREKDAEKKFREEISYRKAIQSDHLATLVINLTKNFVMEIDSDFNCVTCLNGKTADEYFSATEALVAGDDCKKEFLKRFNRRALLSEFSSGEYIVSMVLTRLYDSNRVYWLNYNVHLLQNPDNKDVIAHISCIDITTEKVMQTIMETVAKTDYDYFVVVDGTTDSAKNYAVSSGRQLFNENLSFEAQMKNYVDKYVCEEDKERVFSECKIKNAWEQVKNGEQHKFNFSVIGKDGTVKHKQMQLTAISQSRKTYLMSRIDITNIVSEQETARKKLEKALTAAKAANKAKTEFLSRISHDIRTPMNAVITLAELGVESKDLDETREYMKTISNSGKYLLSIINDVLSYSKVERSSIELHPKMVYLPPFIEETLSIVMPTAKEKGVNISYKTIGEVSDYLRFDTTYIRQIVINLLSNAIKFTSGGGSVELVTEDVSREKNYETIRIIVKDTGIGISREFLPKVFLPFEQENAENDFTRQGTGLGLSIVKSLVELMNGKIWLESVKGEGSTFYVELTLETALQSAAEVSLDESLNDVLLDGKRVLLAEDHPLNTEIAKKLLLKKNMIIDHAANGKIAVEMFENSEINFYDAVLMDIRMPVMNGLEAAAAMRRLKRADAATVPIIAMTANAFDEDVKKSLASGMNSHLAKPIEPKKLYHTLCKLIGDRNK